VAVEHYYALVERVHTQYSKLLSRSTPRLLRSYAGFIENVEQRPAAAREYYDMGLLAAWDVGPPAPEKHTCPCVSTYMSIVSQTRAPPRCHEVEWMGDRHETHSAVAFFGKGGLSNRFRRTARTKTRCVTRLVSWILSRLPVKCWCWIEEQRINQISSHS